MATLYSRLILYSEKHKKPILNHYHRSCLGNIVSDRFVKSQGHNQFIKLKSVELDENGNTIVCKAISYPEFFIGQIDIAIVQYYENKLNN